MKKSYIRGEKMRLKNGDTVTFLSNYYVPNATGGKILMYKILTKEDKIGVVEEAQVE